MDLRLKPVSCPSSQDISAASKKLQTIFLSIADDPWIVVQDGFFSVLYKTDQF